MTHRVLAVASAVVVFAFTTSIMLSQRPSSDVYKPGILHPATASFETEKAAEDAWFGHLQALASDDLKGRKTGTPDLSRPPSMSNLNSKESASSQQALMTIFSRLAFAPQ